MEEAHTFIKRYREDVWVALARRPLTIKRSTFVPPVFPFEFGSHRDQDLVHRLVPDNLRGLLRELPSLPSQTAILLGWPSERPVLVRMNDLPESHQPRSEDPDFWGVWTGKDADGGEVEREIDWGALSAEWQAGVSGDEDEAESGVDSVDGEEE